MPTQYTREELWKLYSKLPGELKEAVFSSETAEHTWNVCERNKIPEEKISLVAAQVGNVLMGLLLPTEFQNALVKQVGIKKDIAQQVDREINRFVFYPVKPALEQLHTKIGEQKEAVAQQKKTGAPAAQPSPSPQPGEQPGMSAKEEPKGDDLYREVL